MTTETMAASTGNPSDNSTRAPAAIAGGARAALWLAAVGVVLYAVLDIVAQLLPPHYSPISQAESDLAVGPYGVVMAVNFVVRGLIAVAFLYGMISLTRLGQTGRIGVGLVAIWGAGAFVLAVFPTDVGAVVTVHGMIHNATALVAFTGGAFGTLLLSSHFHDEERLRRVGPTARGLGALSVLMYFATAAGLFIRRLSPVFGLLERVFIGLVLLWMLVVALTLLRSGRSRGHPAAM